MKLELELELQLELPQFIPWFINIFSLAIAPLMTDDYYCDGHMQYFSMVSSLLAVLAWWN